MYLHKIMNLIWLIPLLLSTVPMAFADYDTGLIYWKENIVSVNSFVDIFVEDDDMNKKEYPNFADKLSVYVWSESSPDGLEIELIETGVYTGIFKGSVYVSDTGETMNNRLLVKPGDILYAKYVDYTLPQGKSQDMISASVVKIKGQDMAQILSKIEPSMLTSKSSQKVPEWVKNNARWWAENTIDDKSFVQAIQFLIKEKLISVDSTSKTSSEDNIPPWVKNNAGWWADGKISEIEFLNGINHLVKTGIISVQIVNSDSKENSQFTECDGITSSYKRLDCEKKIKQQLELEEFRNLSDAYHVSNVIFYYPGMGNLGNELEISNSGQAMLRLRILAENNDSENVTLKCTGPSICSYDVWDGSKAFKYSGMDFVSGQIVIKPGESAIFNMMFGPNIGYGGTMFEYDESKEYFFRINESWGTQMIPLKLN